MLFVGKCIIENKQTDWAKFCLHVRNNLNEYFTERKIEKSTPKIEKFEKN